MLGQILLTQQLRGLYRIDPERTAPVPRAIGRPVQTPSQNICNYKQLTRKARWLAFASETSKLKLETRRFSLQPKRMCKTCQPNLVHNLYGQTVDLFCREHECLTPQAKVWFGKFESILSIGAVGVSRSGKSTLLAALCNHIKSTLPQVALDLLPACLDQFKTSDQMQACTRGIQAIALPHCNKEGSVDGAYVIYDAEGQDLGSTSDQVHAVILGLMSRMTTHLCFMEASLVTKATTRSLGRLVTSNMALARPRNDAALPFLTLVANKIDLAEPDDPLAWLHEVLADSPDGRLVEKMWGDRQQLDFHLVSVDGLRGEDVSTLPAEFVERRQGRYRRQVQRLCEKMLQHAKPFSLASVIVDASSSILSGPDYAFFLERLIVDHHQPGATVAPNISAVETMACRNADQAKTDLLAKYQRVHSQAPHNLGNDNDDVNGAKGTWDDNAARNVWLQQVCSRHNDLKTALLAEFDAGLAHYQGLGLDASIAAKRQELDAALNLDAKRIYFDQQRRIVSSRSESSTQDGPRFERVHHTEEEPNWFKVITHYFWASYVHRWNVHRTIETRGNGDVHEGGWVKVGNPVEVLVEGPGLGPRP
jgi:hypothetical protein